MDKRMHSIGGIGLGAGLMYYLDPERGRRRRALLKDRSFHLARVSGRSLSIAVRDAAHRGHGVTSELFSLFRHGSVSDDVLVARVRSEMGRASSHPHAIEVRCKDGVISLYGLVPESEAGAILARVSMVRGVKSIENRLDVRKDAEKIPALQGGTRIVRRYRITPATALFATVISSVIGFLGIRRRNVPLSLVGATGLGALPFMRGARGPAVLARAGFQRWISVRKTIHIGAPVEQVFGFWQNFENFPYFMSDVRSVRLLDEERSHWVVTGPAGVPVEWDAAITRFVPNVLLAWKSQPGAVIQHAGRVRFKGDGENRTRIDIDISYEPPAGPVGHFAARLFGADPKSKLDTDLMRMKSLVESGPSERLSERVARR